MSLDPDRLPDQEPPLDSPPAAERLRLPAIFLIVVGILNVLLSLYMILESLAVSSQADRFVVEFADAWNKRYPNQPPPTEVTADAVRTWSRTVLIAMVIGALAAAVTIFAATQMLAARNYGLALFGAVLAALPIPCVSCTGCCGLGEAIGIWAIVVLLNEQVKASFR
jgi:hypothetical protein